MVPVPPLAMERVPTKLGVKVWTEPEEEITSWILVSVPVAKVWEEEDKPFREVMELAAQEDQAKPEVAVELAVKHRPSEPTVWMPIVPAPVPESKPPLAMAEALKPKPPEDKAKAWERVRLVMVVVASVEVEATDNVPPTVRRLEIVVLPVMPKVLEAAVQVKLPEPVVVVAAV